MVITTDDTENVPSLDYATLFKILKNLLDDGIQPAMKAHFAAMLKMFTQRMEDILDQTMQVLANIQRELMHLIIDQIT